MIHNQTPISFKKTNKPLQKFRRNMFIFPIVLFVESREIKVHRLSCRADHFIFIFIRGNIHRISLICSAVKTTSKKSTIFNNVTGKKYLYPQSRPLRKHNCKKTKKWVSRTNADTKQHHLLQQAKRKKY
jgi:hypothetical protein